MHMSVNVCVCVSDDPFIAINPFRFNEAHRLSDGEPVYLDKQRN